jgi:hypothetical protein
MRRPRTHRLAFPISRLVADRSEWIPPPTGDKDFQKLNRRRNDAESINRALEDTFNWGRAHSVGHVAQDADLLGFGLGMNDPQLAPPPRTQTPRRASRRLSLTRRQPNPG